MACSLQAIVEVLLAVNAKINITDNLGGSALLEACKAGHDDIITVLRNKGGRLGLDSVNQAQALCSAVFKGDIMYMRRLLRCGANPNAVDYDKRTALHIAAADGNLPAVS